MAYLTMFYCADPEDCTAADLHQHTYHAFTESYGDHHMACGLLRRCI